MLHVVPVDGALAALGRHRRWRVAARRSRPWPIRSKASAGAAAHHQRNELGYKWPFDVGAGTIACDGGALFFCAAGTTYALSRGAGTRGYADIDAIRRVQGSGPPSDPVSRLRRRCG